MRVNVQAHLPVLKPLTYARVLYAKFPCPFLPEISNLARERKMSAVGLDLASVLLQ